MRILAISDTKEGWLYDHYDRGRMEGVDLVVSCGDLPAAYLEHIVTLANVPLVYVRGNHDTAYDERAPEGVDVVVTHAPPRGYGDLDDLPHRGFEAFGQLLDRLRPRLLVHGHVHMEYGRIRRVREHPSGALVVNACGSQVLEVPDDEIPDRTGGFRLPVEPV